MPSNILSIFNPPETRDLSDQEVQDCLLCQIMSTTFSLGFGCYLISNMPFKYGDKERAQGISMKEFQIRNPKWWKYTLKGVGASLLILGIVRGTERWIWNRPKEDKF